MKKEIGNKILLFSIITLFLISVISQSVLAEVAITAEDAKAAGLTAGGALVGFTEGILTPILNPLYGNALATRFMLGILLFMILLTIVPDMIGHEHRLIGVVISLVVTLLAMLSIPIELLTTINTQYGIMGATLLSIIPFAIIFFFTIRTDSSIVARVTWLFYAMYYFGFYIWQLFNQPGDTWYLVTGNSIVTLLAIAAGGILFWFVIPLRKVVFEGEMSAIKETGDRVAERGRLLHKIHRKELEESYGSGI